MKYVRPTPIARPLGTGKGTALAAAVLAAVMGAGCSKGDAPRVPTQPARGQVLFDGKPLSGALVVLHRPGVATSETSTDKSKQKATPPTARGLTDSEGRYALTTYDTGDGVPEGEYAVTVVQRPAQKVGESYEQGPNVLPPRYASPATTDLKVRIAAGQNELAPLALSGQTAVASAVQPVAPQPLAPQPIVTQAAVAQPPVATPVATQTSDSQ